MAASLSRVASRFFLRARSDDKDLSAKPESWTHVNHCVNYSWAPRRMLVGLLGGQPDVRGAKRFLPFVFWDLFSRVEILRIVREPNVQNTDVSRTTGSYV